ncbi:MAG: hypothetical protein ACYSU7_09540 [Planctomycetota bacterium]|jgi:hypothetical protein
MLYLCYVLFALGFLLYVAAAFFIGASNGETLSDIGNAIMLTTTVLLLLRLSHGLNPRGASAS